MSVHALPISPVGHYAYAMLCQDDLNKIGYVKFGISSNVARRLVQLRSGCPIPAKYFALLEVPSRGRARIIERALHKHFADRRVSGEWFRFAFDRGEDKRVFNDGCKLVFVDNFRGDAWWTKISVSSLDAYNAERRNIYLNSPHRKSIAKEARDRANIRKAHKELAAYGTR